MKRKISIAILTLILILSAAVPAAADFDIETRDSIVVVETCIDMDGAVYSFGWGTGFFVGETGKSPQYLVTNHHVIEDFLKNGSGDLVQGLYGETLLTGRSKIHVYYDSSDFEEAYVVDYDELKDVAILRLGSPTDKRKPLKLISPTDDMVGSTIYAVGYPGLAENILADSTTNWGKSDASVTSGTFSRILTTSGTGRVNVQLDCVVRHGNSGGPVVNENSAVLGIATWGAANSDESVNYAVSIDEAITLLDRNNVKYEMWTEPAPVTDQETDTVVVPPPEPDNNTTLYIVIGAGVLILALAAVLAAVLVKKKTPKNNLGNGNGQNQPPESMSSHGQPVVRSLSAHNRGVSAAIRGGQITIGRVRNECAIVFPDGTPGVSGRHCSLSWDPSAGRFILTDLNSTYGTFLENGQRLTPGVPYALRSGDRFYLGEKSNMMSVGLE